MVSSWWKQRAKLETDNSGRDRTRDYPSVQRLAMTLERKRVVGRRGRADIRSRSWNEFPTGEVADSGRAPSGAPGQMSNFTDQRVIERKNKTINTKNTIDMQDYQAVT